MVPQHDDPLKTPVQFVRGVGPQKAALLAKLDIHTVEDLLWRLPRDVLDLTDVRRPEDLEEKVEQTVRGTVVDVDARQVSGGRTLTAVLLDCDGDYVRGVWFNQPWMRQRMLMGQPVLFTGKPKRHQGRWEFTHPQVQWLDDDDSSATQDGPGRILPRYGLTEGLRMHEMRRMTSSAAEGFADKIADPLPATFRATLQLPALSEAIHRLQMPRSMPEYEAARHRVLFDDLFEFQLALAMRRRAWKRQSEAPLLQVTARIDARIRRLFPFPFTEGQNAAIRDVVGDLASGGAMHRLLQADVGAGKTVVAVYAMLAAVACGFQAVLMAPTELLAVQHAETLDAVLEQSRVRRGLLTGSLTAAARRKLLASIRQGETELVVGTQAVIQENVEFARLGVAVIDEQHKFGVAQRARISAGASNPHVLVMTATPIPRSLCLTQFGDLDLTLMTDLPPGRQRVVTSRIAGGGARQKAWDFVKKQLRAGRQAYIVCPLVKGDAEGDAGPRGADDVYQRVIKALPDFQVGLVHGQLDRTDRAHVMDRFRDGELNVLVATTVIEVGVDIPNATLMIVLDAERFGLSQLHQLRGRVSRGAFQGYCFLFSESAAPDAIQRLHALEMSADGFRIAEIDFELRGPGDVLGTRQHGELPLRVADLSRDAEILDAARREAFTLVGSGEFDAEEFAPLKSVVLQRFATVMDLPQSG
ncbi:MAG: ATP-dependent DNA helicase RecG [Planctomycetaceae bacterium]|nr:ATP-dependent DNA helicase RecG [Planctomycetaceae bacterium]